MGCEMIQIQFNVPDEWNEKKNTHLRQWKKETKNVPRTKQISRRDINLQDVYLKAGKKIGAGSYFAFSIR